MPLATIVYWTPVTLCLVTTSLKLIAWVRSLQMRQCMSPNSPITKDLVNRIYLLARSEANKTVVIDIDTQRVEARHINIESEVELASVDEKRPSNILLDYDWSLFRYVLPFVYHTYTDAAGRRRLAYTQTQKHTNRQTHRQTDRQTDNAYWVVQKSKASNYITS